MKRPLLYLSLLSLFLTPQAARATWTIHMDQNSCPSASGLSGVQDFGSYDSSSDCQAHIPTDQPVCVQYSCTDGGGGSPADASLAQTTNQALAEGIVHGDAQTFGIGLMGVLAQAALSSPSPQNNQPSAADIAAQQQAAREQQAQVLAQQEADAAAARKFQAEKQDTLDDLNASDASTGGGTALKDAPNDNPDQAQGQKAHLTPMDNPLDPAGLPGDTKAVRYYDSWDAARASCGASETEALDHDSGKVVVCPKGYPYYATGQCYSNDAFNNLRVPDSVLKTDHQFPQSH